MGRRSSHTADELHQLIVEAASDIVEQRGYKALSARAIASRIGYSPGTLYNVFKDLDHLVLTIEQRLLDGLADRLAEAETSADPVQNLNHLALAYHAFTQERPRLWNVLFEHQMPDGWVVPPPFQARIDRIRRIVEQACVPLVGETDAGQLHRTAVVVWSALHGMTLLATSEKLRSVTHEPVVTLVGDLIILVGKGHGKTAPKRRPRKST